VSNFPAISGKNLVKILQNQGFLIVSTKGSHHFLRHQDGRTTTIPVHSNEIIGKGLLSKILHDCEIDKESFLKML
jgi:predicted RNA binding protein YcfA (HicA-like mRNA interferase family)